MNFSFHTYRFMHPIHAVRRSDKCHFFLFFFAHFQFIMSILIYVYRESQQNLLSFLLLHCGLWIVWFGALNHDRNTWSQVNCIFAEPIIIIIILKRKSQSMWCHTKTPSLAFIHTTFGVVFFFFHTTQKCVILQNFRFPWFDCHENSSLCLMLNLCTLPDGRSTEYLDTEMYQ